MCAVVVVVIAELNLPSGVAKISLHTGEEIAIVVTVEEEGAEVGPHTEEALRIQAIYRSPHPHGLS